MQRIPWTKYVTNKEVYKMNKTKRSLILRIRKNTDEICRTHNDKKQFE